jgi:DNA-binding protein HU-beta
LISLNAVLNLLLHMLAARVKPASTKEEAMARASAISKAELIDTIAEETQLKKKDVKTVVDSLVGQVTAQLTQGNKVTLSGFGTFDVRERQARTAVKPGTTERIQVAGGKFPAFKAGKNLKEQVK